ncbi:DUF4192 domain-containing protein [Umezawaea sp. Da 62-37]|uniref:DUF4192 domain-containing protein n=1 Tax=Umezawaea sp. Da 62-37 TaxID=3075927 RepID=UPI0028F71F87|nr:DUF4192 domain-containing protein [Umezawaea sp. Da 62-37]WNV83107.1 DUF4192 domain-containing protein [Umezawaea sp. Da 62-37]
MSVTPSARVLGEPRDLIAAIPHLLGFHPHDSLVLVCVKHRQTVASLRIDLPPARHRQAHAVQALDMARGQDVDGILLFVIGGGVWVSSASELPHSGLIEVMKQTATSMGMRTILAVWAESTQAGARWHGYDSPDWTGTVRDPSTTALAAATVAAGLVTFTSREELAAQLAPVADEIIARRAVLLDHSPAWRPSGPAASAAFRSVRDAVAAGSDRRHPLEDGEVVELARALFDPSVRDACVSFAFGPRAETAERLWLELTRGCPTSVRANPTVLLALSAYIRGDGALASLALDHALSAEPRHRLGTLLRTSVDGGLPDRIVAFFHDSSIAETERLLKSPGEQDTRGQIHR